jgi:PAS domain S-box-containing protein
MADTKEGAPQQHYTSLLSLVVESAPSGMVMVDAGGVMTLVNAQTERSFGYSRDELLGQPVEMLLPERFRARATRRCAPASLRRRRCGPWAQAATCTRATRTAASSLWRSG